MDFFMSTLPRACSIATSLSLRPRLILFTLFSLLVSIKILIITHNYTRPKPIKIIYLPEQPISPFSIKVKPLELLEPEVKPVPKWVEVIQGNELANKKAVRVGLINFKAGQQSSLSSVSWIAEPVNIGLELVPSNFTWKKLFPGEMHDKPRGPCFKIPVPKPMKHPKLDVVVSQLPCGEGYNRSDMKGIRDVHRLQVSLAAANVLVENAVRKKIKHVYVVFISKCEPMLEMFRCDDLIWHEGDYWIYKPNVDRLNEIISMPIGTCELARPHGGILGKKQLQANSTSKPTVRPREAYVTMLHSSESYVCGAIALAKSILLTNTTKDLILLADPTISNDSISALIASGWKIKRIERIRSPYANLTDYNVWNYSKLRIWQLTEYSKIMFIDSDFIILKNIDHFFNYPQLSASPNHDFIFNSGVMIIEPSICLFKTLMSKRFSVKSYNGGDQGYLNEFFTYWHRLTKKLNHMKVFDSVNQGKRVVPKDKYAIHFLGLKPWVCYRDYDCNWDYKVFYRYASDDFHALWWKVYDTLPKELQTYCGMTEIQDKQIRHWRASAQLGNQSDEHWKIEIRDPRQFNLLSSA